MKRVTYHCNLCLEEKPKEQMLAYYFKSDILPQRYVLTFELGNTDKHICKSCYNIIKTDEPK